MTTFWIEKIERVQAVQDEAGSVPMIGGKPTFLRVFPASESRIQLSGSALVGPAGSATVLHPIGLPKTEVIVNLADPTDEDPPKKPGLPVVVTKTDVVVSEGPTIDRSQWQQSFNFKIPDAFTSPGSTVVQISVGPADGSAPPHVLPATIVFGPRIDLAVYGMVWASTDYSDNPKFDYRRPAAAWSDFEAHRGYTENVFPVSSLAVVPLPEVGKVAPSPQTFQNLTGARRWAADQLATLPPRSVINILNNWVSDNGLHGFTTGRVSEEENGRDPWRVGVVMAHELAHAYGIPWHTFIPRDDSGKPTAAGTPYPHGEEGEIGPGDFGVDLQHGEPTLVGGRFDIMSYSLIDKNHQRQQQWISSFTYKMLLESITAEQAWRSLGGQVTALRSCSWGQGRADLFARFDDGSIRHQFVTPAGLGLASWENLGGNVEGDFAVASWGPDRVDIVARGTDGHLYHKWWDGSGWRPDPGNPNNWQPLGGEIGGAVAATSWGPGRLDVYAVWNDGSVRHLYGTIDGWGTLEWETLGGTVQGPIAATSWEPNRADVFARGTNGHLFHKWWDGAGWKPTGGWEDLGGPIQDAVTAVSSGKRADVYARFPDLSTRHIFGSASGFNPGAGKIWESLGSEGSGAIAAVADGSGLATVITVGVGGQTIQAHRWNGRNWTPTNVDWFDLNGQAAGEISACSWGPGRVDITAIGLDGSVYHKFFDHGLWRSLG